MRSSAIRCRSIGSIRCQSVERAVEMTALLLLLPLPLLSQVLLIRLRVKQDY